MTCVVFAHGICFLRNFLQKCLVFSYKNVSNRCEHTRRGGTHTGGKHTQMGKRDEKFTLEERDRKLRDSRIETRKVSRLIGTQPQAPSTRRVHASSRKDPSRGVAWTTTAKNRRPLSHLTGMSRDCGLKRDKSLRSRVGLSPWGSGCERK